MLDPAHCHHLLIYGGTFDPPHRAHIELPRLACQRLGADGVAYIPAAVSPFKVGQAPASAVHRLAMLRLALADAPWAAVLTDEIDRAAADPTRPSYTVDTLEALHQRLGPGVKLRLLLGGDQLRDLDQWRRFDRIVELAEPVVMLRPPLAPLAPLPPGHSRTPGHPGPPLPSPPPATADELLQQLPPGPLFAPALWRPRLLDLPQLDLSATGLRHRLRHGQSIDDLVSPAVAAYIRAHGLYQS